MKTYELKPLTAKDLFPMLKIINKVGIKEFKTCFNNDTIAQIASGQAKGEELTTIVGLNIFIDVASIIVGNMSKCEDEIYTFLAQISNLSKKEVANLPAGDFLDMIIDVVQKEEFSDFFGRALKLFK